MKKLASYRTCLYCHLNQHGVPALWRHTCVPFSTSISPVALRRSYSSSQADAVPVMSDEVLIRLFLLVVLFFLEEAPLSLECSLNQSSRSSSILIPLMLEAADLSPSLSLLNRKTKWLKLVFWKNDDDDNDGDRKFWDTTNIIFSFLFVCLPGYFGRNINNKKL